MSDMDDGGCDIKVAFDRAAAFSFLAGMRETDSF